MILPPRRPPTEDIGARVWQSPGTESNWGNCGNLCGRSWTSAHRGTEEKDRGMAAPYTKLRRIDLKRDSEYDERWVQNIIAQDPSVLGLGDLVLRDRERVRRDKQDEERRANWRRGVGESPTGRKGLTTTSTASRAAASVRVVVEASVAARVAGMIEHRKCYGPECWLCSFSTSHPDKTCQISPM